MHLQEARYIRVTPADSAGDVRWGLEPLVTMLERAARAVDKQFPDTIMSVGHLSREGGGDVARHRSHESGRDADVGFYIRSSNGHPLLPTHFVPFRPDGAAVGWPGAYFDDAKNWALVAALVGDTEARVTHLFVASPLRARLLAYAERTGVSPSVRMRAAELMQQPRGALPHDDHFHVRIGCPAHMSGCVENPAMRLHRTEPLLAHGRRGDGPHFSRETSPMVTTPPRKRSTPPPPSSPTAPADAPTESDPAMPPASIPAPVDDVDG
jgi:penicillin-insensitive murein endopeptidase